MRPALRLSVILSAALSAPLLAMAPPEAQPCELPRSMVAEVAGPGGSYEIMIAWPDGEPPAAGWPVLYVLDGDDIFAIVALTARRLARAGGRSGVADGVVVGIAAGPLPRRVRDYTPPTPGWVIPAGRPAHGLTTGGAEAFVDLIERRVIPLVHGGKDRNGGGRWRIDCTRETLAGHSFAGLLALHAAATRPALFDGVVAVSPSLWFGNGVVAEEAKAAPGGPRILIAEGGESATEDVAASLAPRARMRFLPLPGQSHGMTMLAATVPAITFAFGRAER